MPITETTITGCEDSQSPFSTTHQPPPVSTWKLWQRAYYDRAARKDEDIRRIARYIVANPLRAGLVRNTGYYPHWDCIWMTDDDETPLVE